MEGRPVQPDHPHPQRARPRCGRSNPGARGRTLTARFPPPDRADVDTAAERLAGLICRTPLVELEVEPPAGRLWLKLECLQPIGSFKLRGALNAMLSAPPERLRRGVWTASAGNMAQGVAWGARRLGVRCRVVVPETAPQAKLDAIGRLGGEVVKTSVADWFDVFRSRAFPGMDGQFIHAFSDPDVMAGNGTIAREVHADLPHATGESPVWIVPFGGGGLSCGIAAAVHHDQPETPVYASEVERQAPLADSLEADEPVEIDYTPSFVDGIGGPYVTPEMFELARRLLAGSIVVSLTEVAAALRLLLQRSRVVAEGAGASSLAAARTAHPPEPLAAASDVVCVISGGNIDTAVLTSILSGDFFKEKR